MWGSGMSVTRSVSSMIAPVSSISRRPQTCVSAVPQQSHKKFSNHFPCKGCTASETTVLYSVGEVCAHFGWLSYNDCVYLLNSV